MMKTLLALTCLTASSLTGLAQQWQGKFEQLGTELPTPNSYRTATGSPGDAYWQQRADYNIKATVDDQTQVLTGEETITYYNNSPQTLSYLWLQLDQNVLMHNSMTDLTQNAEVHDSIPGYFVPYSLGDSYFLTDNTRKDGDQGGFRIKYVKDADGKDLSCLVNFTMMRIDLPQPLKPGEQFSFSIAWDYHQYERMLFKDGRGGYEYFPEDGNYVYTFAQWYPRMCVYDDYEGWQNKQFLGQGEFALTFGNFNVEITVPADHIVGATGWLQNPKKVLSKEQQARFEKARTTYDKPVFIVTEEEAIKNEKQGTRKKSTWNFKAENVRDFAFVSSRKFIWDAMAVKVGDNTPMAMSLYPKEGNPLWEEESTKAIKNTLEMYSSRTIPYPYPVAYSVHTADIGMEYPMICFNWGRPAEDGSVSESTRVNMISVIVHEVGHNFFPMIVNSDERQWAWMDEGLNTFLEGETVRARYPELNFKQGLPQSVTGYMKGDKSIMRPIMTSADNIRDREYGSNSYTKPAAALTLLRETVMGPELFDKAFQEYAERWAFKHPKPADFFRTLEDASGTDLDWFWRGWFYTTDYVDIDLDKVTWYRLNTEVPDLENRNKKVKSGDLNKRQQADDTATDFSDGPKPFYAKPTPDKGYGEFQNRLNDKKVIEKMESKNIYELSFKNKGGLVTPIIIQWTFQDGSTETETLPAEIWRRNEEKLTKVFIKDKEVVNVVIDPDRALGDVDTHNNVFPKLPESKFDRFKKQKN